MKPFVFSADGHIREPKDLFTTNLPLSMRQHSIRAERRDEYMVTLAGEKIIHRVRLGTEKMDLGRTSRRGASELDGRLSDMSDAGIDAEIVFPSPTMIPPGTRCSPPPPSMAWSSCSTPEPASRM